MSIGTRFKQGDVVMVYVPFSNLTDSKNRPALVISNSDYNLIGEDIIICGITSNLTEREYSIDLDQKDMAEGRIYFPSRIKAEKIFALEKSIINRKIGRVNAITLNQTKEALSQLFK